ncbi:MAG: NAD(P)/FAD-dependent oxidoreductase [Terricaulis sp.]
MSQVYDVVVIGAGAAGIGAGRRLAQTKVNFLLVEARDRVGGRAHTVVHDGAAIDLGCNWLHSGDINVMTTIAENLGFEIDRSHPPWEKPAQRRGMSLDEQSAFGRAFAAFEARIQQRAEAEPPVAASAYLEPGCRWNPMINAVFSYISGAHLDRIDARDYARYEDTNVNWRVARGYGALFSACAAGLPLALQTKVTSIGHSAKGARIETTQGVIDAHAAIVALPTSVLETIRLAPELPAKHEAAAALPLGNAEKLYFALEGAEEFPADSSVFPRTDSADMGSYNMRPRGQPIMECYFGGPLARGLAEAGPDAMAAYAKDEIAGVMGAAFPARLTALHASAWAVDEFALGSYSYAKPACAELRQVLAAPAPPLFFAGEACSKHRYSTAHGAFETGWAAAEDAIAFVQRSMPTG